MLGHAPLGTLALGQLPSLEAVALAPGATLPLTLFLVAGAASGEGVLPPIVIGGGQAPSWAAIAPGARLDLRLSLLPGRVTVSARARGAVLTRAVGIAAGAATGDATDDDFLLLLAA